MTEGGQKNYCVYEHVFPNGKKYIGIAVSCKRRWRNNGDGYKAQPKMANAIKKYGWDSVQHNVLFDDLTKDQAERLEQYLIAELHTIENGYNTATGGTQVKGTYLTPTLLEMIRAANRFVGDCIKSKGSKLIYEQAYDDRYNKEAAGFWNEAERAVTIKHGIFSQYDEIEVARFWYHVGQYCILYDQMQQGKDVSGWKEKPLEDALYDHVFRKDAKNKKAMPEQMKLF